MKHFFEKFRDAGRIIPGRCHWAAAAFALLFAQGAWAGQGNITVAPAFSHPYIIAGDLNTVYLKVGLKGEAIESSAKRPPVNIALVLDKSGSMSGQKIEDVKQATKMLIDRLRPDDVLSVITYDYTAQVLVPATRLDRPELIKARIDGLYAGGSTALYDGVQTGAYEIRKFMSDNQINRVILLSDGLANIGPQTPDDLGRLGASLVREGISVSTIGIGLGYNEDLMTRLASMSDGFHQFAQNSEDLTGFFDWEFGKVAAIVGKDVSVDIRFAEGIRPLRILGRDGRISGGVVTARLNQIFSSHEIYVLVEAEILPGFAANSDFKVADVEVGYFNLSDNAPYTYRRAITASVTGDRLFAEQSRNPDVMTAALNQKGALAQEEAIRLRDQGRVQEAQQTLEEMSSTLTEAGKLFGSHRLKEYGDLLKDRSQAILDDLSWNENRKTDAAHLEKVQFAVE